MDTTNSHAYRSILLGVGIVSRVMDASYHSGRREHRDNGYAAFPIPADRRWAFGKF